MPALRYAQPVSHDPTPFYLTALTKAFVETVLSCMRELGAISTALIKSSDAISTGPAIAQRKIDGDGEQRHHLS